MKWIEKLQRRYGRYAIPNLMNYIVICYVIGYFLQIFLPNIFGLLQFNMNAILHGQIWRLFTFIFYPPSFSPFTFVIACYLYWMLGSTLERVWGSFRFNLYFLVGFLGHIIAGLLMYLMFGVSIRLTTTYLNASLFFAFAATYPDMEFLLFFLIPIKAKWLGIANGAIYLVSFFTSSWTTAYGWGTKMEIVFSLLNFILFFFATRNYNRINPRQIKRRREFKQNYRPVSNGPRHKCAVCGRTELDGEDLEFRYCSKCEGAYEYCQDHLYTHRHVTKQDIHQG